ncbi:hypothetical protein [Sebaldella sp. S0638]|uniref:hypothetical protein n=1 Tax=Sebaldella sp. S0638 TaxID=2957809 RepID=UPI00209C9D5B|nr:hypothetical protein [Sebaldella sp. S0638]MCP1223705.1 hypothetical protein [Sebaldella sp. S0638]
MKKVILIMLLFTVMISAKTPTKAEKQEMLRQFVEFQNIVKNKDIDGFISMLEFPDIRGFLLIMGPFTAEEEKEITRDREGIIVTEKMLRRHSAEIFEDLEVLNDIKVDLDKGKVENYFVDNATEEDKKKKYFFDRSRDCYYYYNSKKEKVYLENLRIWDNRTDLEFMEDGLYVLDYLWQNKLTPEDSFMGSGFVYVFSFKENKLRLQDLYVND